MAQKPSIAKGTRDFSPFEVTRRNYIINSIKRNFILYGFQPIETPSFENSSTLLGKYGEEGDRLIFKILNSGDFLKKVPAATLSEANSHEISGTISDKALRYDLTVPFARYVVQHQNEIEFPFKRYQIQPVWRADRPQKGRFREFYQCDADVVGSNSLWQEVDFLRLYDSVFTDLGLEGVTIKLNNRKILSGIAETMGIQDQLIDFTVALDKLDKIGEEGVRKELDQKGITKETLDKAAILFDFTGDNTERLEKLSTLLVDSAIGSQGVTELRFIQEALNKLPLQTVNFTIDITLARGLNYYTGTIIEVAAPERVPMGSIGGGGRYDDLTGIFGLKNMGGMGISFGLDRIYLVLEALDLFPKAMNTAPGVLFLNFGEQEAAYAMSAITTLRKQKIPAELYPDAAKMKKQMNYADKRNFEYVVLIGSDEITSGRYGVKNMKSGEQQKVSLEELMALLQKEYDEERRL